MRQADERIRVANEPLSGRVALVTGGASGIGRATALALAAAGARVAVVDRDADGAASVAKEADAGGGAARAFGADLADATTIEPLVAAVLAELGRVDILVNCAGITGGVHTALDFSDDTFETVMHVNVRAPFLLTRAVGRHMVDRGGGGRIVNVSSSAAFRATSSPAVYAASKAAINGLTRAAAADLGPYDVNVNAVAPGITKTPMTAGIGDDDMYTALSTTGPLANLLHRASEPEDVANVIVFLCLPESRQITGQVVNTGAGVVV
jgi:NAD(P)-dependent dehydrogenase (short-subunit alcohol dehydrogenase family)